MLQSLPSNIRLKLEQTLAQWPQWNCDPVVTRAPTFVNVLTSGISNHSVLVESEQHFVIRIDGIKPSTFGLSRQTEWRALQAAYNAGLAPRPCYFNPDLGSLVCDYLVPDIAQGLNTAEVARLLHNIHKLPARHHRLNLTDRISHYEKQLKHQDSSADKTFLQYGAKVSHMLEEINACPGELVLCHNDLLSANRIHSAGKLWAIDWEYCAMGSPWFDIAAIVNGDALTDHETGALLKAYLGRAINDRERGLLHRYSCIYRYLELLWYKALDTPVLNSLAVEEKSVALESMLKETVK